MQLKFPAVLFVIISIAAVCFGAQSEWVKFTSPEGRFSISLPHEPKSEKEETPDPKGAVSGRYVTMEDGYVLICEYYDVDIPAGTDSQISLDAAREGIIAGAHATKLSEKQVSLDGHAGRELQLTFKVDSEHQMAATIRFFLVGNRLYSLSYVHRPDLDEKVSASISEKFFTSFKLLNK